MSDDNKFKDIPGTVPLYAAEGTYYPVTDGWAVGYRFHQKGQPARYIVLNPTSDSDDGQANVFVYEGEHDTIDNLSPVHFYDIGDKIHA